jgi:hypothetical protein
MNSRHSVTSACFEIFELELGGTAAVVVHLVGFAHRPPRSGGSRRRGRTPRHDLRRHRRARQRNAALARQRERRGQVFFGDLDEAAHHRLEAFAVARRFRRLVQREEGAHRIGEVAVGAGDLFECLLRQAGGATASPRRRPSTPDRSSGCCRAHLAAAPSDPCTTFPRSTRRRDARDDLGGVATDYHGERAGAGAAAPPVMQASTTPTPRRAAKAATSITVAGCTVE